METLFNFIHIRPPVEPREDITSISLATESTFQEKLREFASSDTPREKIKGQARKFVASKAFIGARESLLFDTQLRTVGASFDALQEASAVDPDDLVAAVEEAFGKSPTELVAMAQYQKELSVLKDSILAIKFLPEEHRRPLHHITQALRDMMLFQVLAEDAHQVDLPERLRRYRQRSLLMPEGLSLGSILRSPRKKKQEPDPDETRKAFDEGMANFKGILGAIDELTRIDGQKLVQSPVKPSKALLPPKALQPQSILKAAFDKGYSPYLSPLQSAIASPSSRVNPNMTRAVPETDNAGMLARMAEIDFSTPLVMADKAPMMARTTFAGRTAFEPSKPESRSFLMTAEAGAKLSKNTQQALKLRNLSVTAQPVDEVVSQLRVEAAAVGQQLEKLADPGVHRTFKRIGNTMVLINSPIATPWVMTSMGISAGTLFPLPELLPLDVRVPRTHGDVKPVGVADLLVVKQFLKRYEARDIAHIENVLQGEGKERTHRRRNQTEELTFREVETTTSEERELESTDRFEMARESSETIQEDAKLKAGMSITAKYGPAVEFSASVEGSYSRSKTEVTKSASTFSKEVTQRSSKKIAERVLERESRKITTEVEETNKHTLDNTGGDGHVRGIYQWIEKVYEAQMFNYGLRTMFDFMVPEPGAFLLEALRRAHVSATELVKPMPFSIRPDQLTEFNYHTWVSAYHATDVTPPPEPYITKSHDYNAGGGDDKTDYNHSSQIQIDEGYRAIYATVGVVGNTWSDEASVDVVVGQRGNRISNAGIRVWHTSLDNEVLAIPLAINSFDHSDLAIAVEVKCQRTDRAMAKWRHETHAKLTTAYLARLAEYEEKLAALKAEAGIVIEGKSPALNQEIMVDELKKACISIMTEQHYELFNAVETGSNGLPQVNLWENEAEGPYVRFFEQAFEWEQMTWLTYPYFWGRKSQWSDRIAMEDADPLFNQFMKAGYCRVVVPLRPGFEGAVDHFMNFGEPWMGGPLPAVTSDLYLPIAEEIAERLGRPGEEVPEGEPWEVRFPTSLVRLRDDGSLPAWEKDEEGNWLPVDG